MPFRRRIYMYSTEPSGGALARDLWRALQTVLRRKPEKKRPVPREYRCSFCDKEQQKVDRLIAGPGEVYICNECIERYTSATTADSLPDSPARPERCSFCGMHRDRTKRLIATWDQRLLATRDRVAICDECLDLCAEIVAEEQETPRPS